MATAYWVARYRTIKNQEALAARTAAVPDSRGVTDAFIVAGKPAKPYQAGIKQCLVQTMNPGKLSNRVETRCIPRDCVKDLGRDAVR